MNKFKNILNIQNRNTVLNYFRPSSYLAHPELKIKSHNERWRMLLIMRDLRLWIHEYAPWSSRSAKYHGELEQLTREIQYLQFFSMFKAFCVFAGITLYVIFWGPQHYNGSNDFNSRPIIATLSGGMTIMHDGGIPKLEAADKSELLGI